MQGSDTTRRDFLVRLGNSAGLVGAAAMHGADLSAPADVTLRIAPVQLEIAPGRMIRTVGYNGAVPGPLLRFREGVSATVDLFNDTDATEYVHWHGFDIPASLDGA